MPTRARFPRELLETITRKTSLRIRAGSASHRFIGIWAVVVEGRLFVRSWNDKAAGWNRAWREDPVGAIEVDKVVVPVRAKTVRGEKLLDAISAAYLAKYSGPGSVKYARGLGDEARRKTTLELVAVE